VKFGKRTGFRNQRRKASGFDSQDGHMEAVMVIAVSIFVLIALVPVYGRWTAREREREDAERDKD
jgi:heme/copper-type cytochrome/quinol oxidase subunit 2